MKSLILRAIIDELCKDTHDLDTAEMAAKKASVIAEVNKDAEIRRAVALDDAYWDNNQWLFKSLATLLGGDIKSHLRLYDQMPLGGVDNKGVIINIGCSVNREGFTRAGIDTRWSGDISIHAASGNITDMQPVHNVAHRILHSTLGSGESIKKTDFTDHNLRDMSICFSRIADSGGSGELLIYSYTALLVYT